jgi:hypothetical protein
VGAGSEEDGFEGEKVVAEVFAGVRDDRGLGGGVKQFYAQHGLDGNGVRAICSKG